jgi:uncharacterized protein YehS (DUF1456 family)
MGGGYNKYVEQNNICVRKLEWNYELRRQDIVKVDLKETECALD